MEEIKSKLRKRAREEVTPVPTLYNEALVELSTQPDRSDVAPTLPTYSSFKSSMYRSRRKRLPPLPKTRAEIDLTGDCYFHFSQCLWRKVQALGMADLYKNDADTRNFIHKAAALPFIPPRFIRIAWILVESEAPKTSKADEFIRYF